MKITEIEAEGWQKIVHVEDANSGLSTVISVHDTTLGPGCGGCRVFPYVSFDAGLEDAKRLSRGMTYKNALADIPFGGGKSVIFANPATDKTHAMMEAMGRAVEALEGIYYTAEDSGMTEQDIQIVGTQTKYAAGIDGHGRGGNPSPHTARGVWRGIQAAARYSFGTDDMTGKTVGILGIGAVGMALAEHLHQSGAHLVVADVNEKALCDAKSCYGADTVSPDQLMMADVDIVAPCALGGAVNADTVDKIKARIVAGAANNQLKTPEMGARLHERGILYAPDYVINAAGVISVGLEILGEWSEPELNRRIDNIGNTLDQIFERSQEERLPTSEIADVMADEKISRGATAIAQTLMNQKGAGLGIHR